MFQPITRDDAGRHVSLVHFNLFPMPFLTGPLPWKLQQAIRGAVKAEYAQPKIKYSRQALLRGGGMTVITFIVMCGGYELLTYSGLLQRPGSNRWLIVVLLCFPLYVIFVFLFMSRFGSPALTDHARKMCADMAAFAGHCGSCGYMLSETPNTENKLSRCSECGAAWVRSNPSSKTAVP